MPRSYDQMTSEERKRLGLNKSLIDADMQSNPTFTSLGISLKTTLYLQRFNHIHSYMRFMIPKDALNIAVKHLCDKRINSQEFKDAMDQEYARRALQQKVQVEKYKEKQKISKKLQNDFEWNLNHYAIHLDVPSIRKKLDEIAEDTDIDTLSDLFEKSTKRQLKLNLNEVEWNSLSNWLAGHVETAKIRALQKLDKKCEEYGLKKKSSLDYAS